MLPPGAENGRKGFELDLSKNQSRCFPLHRERPSERFQQRDPPAESPVTAQRQRSNADGVVPHGWMTADSALILTICCDAPRPAGSKLFDSPRVCGPGKEGRIAQGRQSATSIP